MNTGGGGGHERIDLHNKFDNVRHMIQTWNPSVMKKAFDLKQSEIHNEHTWELAKRLIKSTRFCSFCNKIEYATDVLWKCCHICHMGRCCSQDHFDKYKSQHTDEICSSYQKAFTVDRFLINHIINYQDTFQFIPETALSEALNIFPNCWEEYFKIRCPSIYIKNMKSMYPKEFLPAATKQLTQVTSCLYSMYQHDQNLFTNIESLTIHVVGASIYELEGGAPSCVWEDIMHCLPSVNKLSVVFVGPEATTMMKDNPKKYVSPGLECCPDCQAKGRQRIYSYYGSTYHEYYFDKESFQKPDFVVAFNTGMYEEYTESWKESLKVILDLDVPSFFTSFNEEEAIGDFEVLRSLNACTLTSSPVKNPFSVDYPIIDANFKDSFYQINCFGTGFKGREVSNAK